MQKLEVIVKFLFRLPSLCYFFLFGIAFGLYIQYEFRGKAIDETHKDFQNELSDCEFDFQDVISFTFWLFLIGYIFL